MASFFALATIVLAFLGPAAGAGKLYLFHVVALAYGMISVVHWDEPASLSVVLRGTKLALVPLAMCAWFVVTLLWCPDVPQGATYCVYIACGVLATCAAAAYASGGARQCQIVVIVLVFCALGDVVVGLLEVATPFRLPCSVYWPGNPNFEDLQKMFPPDHQVWEVFDEMPTGFHGNPNTYATVLNLMLPFALFLLRSWAAALFAIAVVALEVYAQSRIGVVTAGIILGLSTLFPVWKAGVRWAVLCLMALAALVVLANASGKDVIPNTEDRSADSRRELISNGLWALQESWGLGVGAGGDYAVQQELFRGDFLVVPMHNYWIELLVNGGVVFFVVYLLWYLALCWRMAKIAYGYEPGSFEAKAGAAACVSLVAFIPGVVTCSSAIYLLPMWLFLGFCIGLINTVEHSGAS